MSNPSSRRLTHQRRLGLLAAGVVVSGLLAGIPAATAAGSGASGQQKGALASSDTTFTDGRYVVILREPSAATYAGDGRYARTSARGRGQFRGDRAAVRAYSQHLRSTHASIAREYGATLVAHYTIAANGFAAKLTKEQAIQLSSDRRVLLLTKDEARQVDTWNTPDFLGLTGNRGAWAKHGGQKKAGAGVVVGVIDTGIWPESKSFEGKKLTRNPKTKFRIVRHGSKTRMKKADGGTFTGKCQAGEGWERSDCNRKLISARYYADAFVDSVPPEDRSPFEFISARDGSGHGSHTASTAAGNDGVKAKTEGVKFGKVSGMAPAAKVAAYKVCWEDNDPNTGGCFTSSILSAIDDTVFDGVDVINFSISGAQDTVIDPVELAFEGAAEAGIFVTTSAGNSGPTPSTVAHNDPWVTTVAASTHHNFENTVVLGNDTEIVGASISPTSVPSSPLVDSADSGVAGGDPEEAELCAPDSLDPAVVGGTIVVCTRGVYDRVAKSAEVERAGGVAMILANAVPGSLDADFHAVPTVHIPDTASGAVFDYIDDAGASATAEFKLGNLTPDKTALPQIAAFSSRGPATANDSDLLKPDIAAPGVSVLAAVAPPSNSGHKYDLYSGTSMASPHIAGLAAFMSGVHPNWTAQEIKSAMMTTAKRVKDEDGSKSHDLFAQGSGQVRPKRFFDPGWFVTSGAREWRGFLTGQGLDTGVPALDANDVNLPSMAQGQVPGETSFTRTFHSTMKGTWDVSFSGLRGFDATASRQKLESHGKGDVQKLTVTLTRTDAPLTEWSFGKLKLNGPTKLRLPIAVRPVSVKAPAVVRGSGTDGSVPVEITAGFTGDLPVGVSGLARADSTEDSVPAGDFDLSCVEVADPSKLARFDVDAADDTADLDLYILQAENCSDPDTIFALAGQSATGSADESVKLTDPEPGSYWIEVDGFAAGEAGSPMDYRLDFYDVNAAATLGNLTADPNPVPVQQGVETSFDVSWTGLAPDGYYLGILEYEGSLSPTYVEVTS